MEDESLYRDLQRHLDRMPVPFPATDSGVELRILRRLFTPEDVRIALCVSAFPEPLATIRRRIKPKLSVGALREALDGMADRGLIQREAAGKTVRYGKLPFAIGMYEYQVNRLTPEFERDALQYLDEAFGRALHSARTPQMRTIPINRSVVPERAVAQYDDIREFVRKSEGPFAAINCICRQGKDLLGKPCRQTDTRQNCLVFGPMARMVAERGVGRSVTKEEMLGLLDHADEQGLVLQPQNTQTPVFVCCCCGCCCGVLGTAKKMPRPADLLAANYHAESDAEKCQSCGTCVTRCQMDAITADGADVRIDLSRCIGCGLCVSTCPSGAMSLKSRTDGKVPPKDMQALYTKIFQERYGPWGAAKAVGRNFLGLQV